MIRNNFPLVSAELALVIATGLTLALTGSFYRINGAAAEAQQVSAAPTATQMVVKRYKVARSIPMLPDRNGLLLIISASPEDFVRDKMAELAHQLNQDFSEQSKLIVDILDDEKTAQNVVPAGAEFSLLMKLQRGQYYLDREKNQEYIAFSTKRGKPANEVVINFGQSRPKWLKKRRATGRTTH